MDFSTADRPTLERMLADPRFGEPMKDRIRARLATMPASRKAPKPRRTASAPPPDLGQLAARAAALQLVIFGPPRTKKTSNRLVIHGGRRKVLPSAAWCAWRDAIQATGQIPNGDHLPLPERPMHCMALFYRQADTGDLVGYQQGLADILEETGVITNDRFIVSWDGTRLLVDRACPRVELVLAPMAEGAA